MNIPKIDKKKVTALAAKGFTAADIARHEQCSAQYISKLLFTARDKQKEVLEYCTTRAAALDTTALAIHGKLEALVRSYDISVIPDKYKAVVIECLVRTLKLLHEQSRLEKNMTTQNSGVIVSFLHCTRKSPLDLKPYTTERGEIPHALLPQGLQAESEAANAG